MHEINCAVDGIDYPSWIVGEDGLGDREMSAFLSDESKGSEMFSFQWFSYILTIYLCAGNFFLIPSIKIASIFSS